MNDIIKYFNKNPKIAYLNKRYIGKFGISNLNIVEKLLSLLLLINVCLKRLNLGHSRITYDVATGLAQPNFDRAWGPLIRDR